MQHQLTIQRLGSVGPIKAFQNMSSTGGEAAQIRRMSAHTAAADKVTKKKRTLTAMTSPHSGGIVPTSDTNDVSGLM